MVYSILDKIQSPKDIKKLTDPEKNVLCTEIRDFLINSVSSTGGHFASNLGTVELTVALHSVFDLRRDRLVFDVGHQCYTHKILTGRREEFSTLRRHGGLSGFPKPSESEYDAFIAGHASASVSAGLGLARASRLSGRNDSVVVLIGDGALTGGLAYEGLSDAGGAGERLIVALNDNGMSIAKNVGGPALNLSKLRLRPAYLAFKRRYRAITKRNAVTKWIYRATHGVKEFVKKILLRDTIFEKMGFTYIGPVDGHDIISLENALNIAKNAERPVLLHVNTQKGRGYAPAEAEPEKYHGVSPFNKNTGILPAAEKATFSSEFGKALCALAREDKRICAITAAMTGGTGLREFANCFGDRFFDVGIAEGHAVTMAAGLSRGGFIPVFCVYSTFLPRAIDMLIHDAAISGEHIVLAVDRAGFVPGDGETHQGIFDMGLLANIPNCTVFAPADYEELRDMLRTAVLETPGIAVVRYPKGAQDIVFGRGREATSVVYHAENAQATVVSSGLLTGNVCRAGELCSTPYDIIKLGRILPIDIEPIANSVLQTGVLVVVEDNFTDCLAGAVIKQLGLIGIIPAAVRTLSCGGVIPKEGTVGELQEDFGLSAEKLAVEIKSLCAEVHASVGKKAH
ncbi:MAG: 1-deoxy-D-xylulose-5-phosphate synthase [Oscillospiraceae bacterium]|jgi:1-deoxy-D-xylulose-5-phosphate synthase|nr:1-deoxy-D-xylulose-5-phosphate synthase [Oscillospiraceae bacterium]